jgi:hypothetical protein
MWFEVDMKQQQVFNRIDVEAINANWSEDFIRECDICFSDDGNDWRECMKSPPPLPDMQVTFPEKKARYFRLTLTKVDAASWWTIEEVYVYLDDANVTMTIGRHMDRVPLKPHMREIPACVWPTSQVSIYSLSGRFAGNSLGPMQSTNSGLSDVSGTKWGTRARGSYIGSFVGAGAATNTVRITNL